MNETNNENDLNKIENGSDGDADADADTEKTGKYRFYFSINFGAHQ